MGERQEKDAIGVVLVPENAYYGAGTQRAVENFMQSGLRLPVDFIHHLALVKLYAAEVNRELGLLPLRLAGAIERAADEAVRGHFDGQFVVDLFQTGSGTSTNMNMNEVLAARANELLTGVKAGKHPVHPNDHVNLGQSSNDVIPTVTHVTAAVAINARLLPALDGLESALQQKADAFGDIPKIGRTHLQDAVPLFLGDEFSGYARQVALARERVHSSAEGLRELALGGTAVGNGLNAHPAFAAGVIRRLAGRTGIGFAEAANHFEAQACRDAVVHVSGSLRTLATALIKIANDIRWMGSGPRCGLGEIRLPELQPGSSIMPGKINPVIPESVVQAAAQVIGNDTAVAFAGQGGHFELNAMIPVMAYNLLQSIHLLSLAADSFVAKCIHGLEADEEACRRNIDRSLAQATLLVPALGYDRASQLAREAYRKNKTIRETVIASGDPDTGQLLRLLDGES
jgi:fumarate hydratase class II